MFLFKLLIFLLGHIINNFFFSISSLKLLFCTKIFLSDILLVYGLMVFSGVSSQVDCAIKIRNLESKLDSVVCTIKDRKELEKHVPMPSEVVVEYDKAASLWSLHEQLKQMEVAVEEAAQSSSRRSKWQFMGARDAGAKEELRQVYGVSERTESDGAANLIQKLRAINYALGELGQWCAYKVSNLMNKVVSFISQGQLYK